MTELKLIGAFFLILCSIGSSYGYTKKEKEALEVLSLWISLIRYLQKQIDHYLTPIEDIFKKEDYPNPLPGGIRAGTAEELLSRSRPYLSPVAAEELEAFVKGLGKGYREEQLKHCAYTLENLDRIQKKAAAALPQRARVAWALFLSAAAGISILFW